MVKKRFRKHVWHCITSFFFVSGEEKWKKNSRGGGGRRIANHWICHCNMWIVDFYPPSCTFFYIAAFIIKSKSDLQFLRRIESNGICCRTDIPVPSHFSRCNGNRLSRSGRKPWSHWLMRYGKKGEKRDFIYFKKSLKYKWSTRSWIIALRPWIQ
jgi:hypothetical protein